ncbi:MAG: dihydrofolate reductase [Candidatus Puniceispirillum sp.]|jgi:dihydrofolate reductase|uniref:dihydrofolate reductase n=1 Tax=Candidatus Puniceispirillum sp. TaxID=2026719 RepID=UPI001ED0C329|nr:dihydrofolate reductase [Candidatus Puniceispirillum sp.]MBT6415740.1 dihydrofolate reductase [Candidatus Puniceispirillum sp.]MBT6566722.1 dihydrofolate reductase [Candidatus Puniceispirillum sp.]
MTETNGLAIQMTAVVAMAKNRIIGDGAGLLWHLRDDLKRVKALTMGCPLIMGRKTWDSIGRPLPGRASIVMTRDPSWTAEGAHTVADMPAAIAASIDWINATEAAKPNIILFGGGEIYQQGLEYCNRIEMTIVDLLPDGGASPAYFPDINPADWHNVIEADIAVSDDAPAFRYETLTRLATPRELIA